MHDPPHVNVPLAEALLVLRKQVHVFGHQQGLLRSSGVTHSVWRGSGCLGWGGTAWPHGLTAPSQPEGRWLRARPQGPAKPLPRAAPPHLHRSPRSHPTGSRVGRLGAF